MRTRTSAPRRSQRAVVMALVLGVLSGLVMPFAAVPAAEAVPGPESIAGSYIHWRVVDPSDALLGGSTFTIERSVRNMWSWSDFRAHLTVSDCVVASCSSTGDRDPDAGEFQVSLPADGGWMGPSYRYRVSAATPPAGYAFGADASRAMPESTWNTSRYDFDTFKVAPRAPLVCTTGSFYSLEDDGTVHQITRVNNSSSVTSFTGTQNLSFANALGIGVNGEVAYMLERTSGTGGVGSILRYSRAAGWESVFGGVSGASGTAAVAGAVSPDNGRYYFGGPLTSNEGFRLFSYDHASQRVATVGTLQTRLYVNGDMGFDARGNLVIVQGTSVFTVSRATLDTANGGSLGYGTATGASFASDVNGIAFDADGSIYASTGTAVRRHVQSGSTWALASNTAVATIPSSSDLASCQSPVTVTVRKDVPVRAFSGDQFTLEMRQGTTGAVLGSAMTSGNQSSVQTQAIAVPTSGSYTITETGSPADLANYSASWSCASNGLPYTSGTGSTIPLTTPPTAGAEVVCTFTNASLVTNITVRKDVQDVNGTTAPRNGWSVGATVGSGATQIGAVTTSNQRTSSNGTASWTIRHTDASANAQVSISEGQQPGFDLVSTSSYCEVTPFQRPTVRTTIRDARDTPLSIAPGSTVNCVFTNQVKPTTLTLLKEVTFGTATTNLFTLTAAAPSAAPPGTLAGPTGTSGTPAATNVRITPGIAYRLSESGGPATYAQVGNWTCVNQAGATVAVTSTGNVTADQGDSVTCRVRNATAALVLLERIEGSSTLKASQFSLTATPADLSTLRSTTVRGDDQVTSANTIQVLPGHSYSLTSTSAPSVAHIGLRLECYTGPGSTSCFNGATAPTAAQLADQSNWRTQTATTASVAPGTTAYYRFVAASPTPFSLPITGGIGTDQIHLLGGGLAALALLTGLGLLLHRRRRAA